MEQESFSLCQSLASFKQVQYSDFLLPHLCPGVGNVPSGTSQGQCFSCLGVVPSLSPSFAPQSGWSTCTTFTFYTQPSNFFPSHNYRSVLCIYESVN